MELSCYVHQYAWGKVGHQSEVALLKKDADPSFIISDNCPYAELWMGTHPSGPSLLKDSGEKLEEWIKSNPETLGSKVREAFGDQLPYLFKVLSVQKALSIQAHPSKAHAEELHKKHPNLYKDPNHKPEIAIALTPFEALCGFRPAAEIKNFLENIVELRILVGQEVASQLMNSDETGLQKALKDCFSALMTCPDDRVLTQTNAFIARLSNLDEDSRERDCASLFERLHSQFPGDVGCFVIYFLNYLKLSPGEAIYLGPNEPHAYIYGDCVECMSCSDNVVRAGLTPKHRDVATLCEMLNYVCGAERKFSSTKKEDAHTTLFAPPIKDFAVAKIDVPGGCKNYKILPRSSASICIVIQGQFEIDSVSHKRGSVIFLPAGQSLVISNSEQQSLLIFQAFSNV
ncbi:hypothetical protein J437_LFUL006253 [Ladona fulva]|uniref:mannose-6-phosphate isomerase n=1 Tax=Ladona fulva TaxID=123851 RepID=A0A8K0K6S4_LADFU|nr:hypothetical protein J437_LFUL006253 [Ladona fulva]